MLRAKKVGVVWVAQVDLLGPDRRHQGEAVEADPPAARLRVGTAAGRYEACLRRGHHGGTGRQQRESGHRHAGAQGALGDHRADPRTATWPVSPPYAVG